MDRNIPKASDIFRYTKLESFDTLLRNKVTEITQNARCLKFHL